MAFVIPGSIISAADQAKAAANAATAALQPTYTDMLATIKSGSIFKDTSSQLGALTNIGVDGTTMTSITAMVDKAKANMGIDMAVANAALAQKAKERQAAGETLTDADKEAAMAPMNVLKNLQSKLASTMSSVSSAVSSHASTLGASLSGTNPVADVNAAASAATAFKATVPAETIGGQPNPLYTAFAAVSANVPKLAALTSIASAAASAGSSLMGSLSSDAAAAASAKASTISTLKADAMLATLTKPMPTAMAALAGNNLNLGSIDKYAAIKAQEAPATVVVEKTPDPNRPGSASIVSENSAALGAPDNAKRIWTYELSKLAADRDAAQAAYYSAYGTTTSATPAERNAAMSEFVANLLGPEKNSVRQQSLAIKKAKPDVADRTPEEIAITEQSQQYAKDLIENNATYINVQVTLFGKWKELSDWYKELYNTWIGPNDRFTLNAKLLARISKYTA